MHWKTILGAAAGILVLAGAVSAGSKRSQGAAEAPTATMAAPQAPMGASRPAPTSSAVVPAAPPPAVAASSQPEAVHPGAPFAPVPSTR